MSKETASILKPASSKSQGKKIRGTLRQRKAIAILAENGGIVSDAMRKAGYSKISAATPKKLTESIAYKAYADRIPDDLLERVHLEGLKAHFKGEPDFTARHKYLDSAYRLKGSYAPEKSQSLNISLEVTAEERARLELAATHSLQQLDE